MKEVRTVRMVEQVDVVFIADDGKEFTGKEAEFECAKYERTRNKNTVKEAFERLDYTVLHVPLIDWMCDECKVYRVLLNSKADFYAMSDYFDVVYEICDNYLKAPGLFPCVVTVVMDSCCTNEYTGNLEAEFENALLRLRSFSKSIKKNEVKSNE